MVAEVGRAAVPTTALDGELAVFDFLHLRGHECQRPHRDRRRSLEGLIAAADGPLVRPARRLAVNGLVACRGSSIRGPGGEGPASLYVGGSTRAWLNVKQDGLDRGRAPMVADALKEDGFARITSRD
jgi:hypothetical protein